MVLEKDVNRNKEQSFIFEHGWHTLSHGKKEIKKVKKGDVNIIITT